MEAGKGKKPEWRRNLHIENPSVYQTVCISIISLVFWMNSAAMAELGPSDLLILVNSNSPASRYIAKMYQGYYPCSADQWHILELGGLADCAGPKSMPADEIITREEYTSLIAGPVRDYILENNLFERVKVIVTTAGLPYRIEDTYFADVIDPAYSNCITVGNNRKSINAASVESELACLWYSEANELVSEPFGINNRFVNPYQGYRRSEISLFERAIPGSKVMNWDEPISFDAAPIIEGNAAYCVTNRSLGPGDIYLTCRLDGPKRYDNPDTPSNEFESVIFSVRRMLERSKIAQSLSKGINPAQAVVVLDDAPGASNLDDNRIYNVGSSKGYFVFESDFPQPPDSCYPLYGDDFCDAFAEFCDSAISQQLLNAGFMPIANNLCIVLDQRPATATRQVDFEALLSHPELLRTGPQYLVALSCYGVYNGDEGRNKCYLLQGGPGGTPLFTVGNGAVFTSIESYNALTFFSNALTTQAKIIDFIELGGTGAIGHAFEPVSDAIVDNYFFLHNLFADYNHDNRADLTFVEAAFTGLPFLSWAEVVIGDPLMRIAYGPGGGEAWTEYNGDVNQNNVIDSYDLWTVRVSYGGKLDSSDPELYTKYNDLCDVNQNRVMDSYDLYMIRMHYGDRK